MIMHTKTYEITAKLPHPSYGAADKLDIPKGSKLISYEVIDKEPADDFMGYMVRLRVTIGRWFPYGKD